MRLDCKKKMQQNLPDTGFDGVEFSPTPEQDPRIIPTFPPFAPRLCAGARAWSAMIQDRKPPSKTAEKTLRIAAWSLSIPSKPAKAWWHVYRQVSACPELAP